VRESEGRGQEAGEAYKYLVTYSKIRSTAPFLYGSPTITHEYKN
jgi:hypothetical protein